MNNFGAFITPEQAADISIKEGLSDRPKSELISYFTALSKNNKRCAVCDEKVWRYADSGMCFSCTTGESDASNDYELILTSPENGASEVSIKIEIIDSNGLPRLIEADEFVLHAIHAQIKHARDIGSNERPMDIVEGVVLRFFEVMKAKGVTLDEEDVQHIAKG